MKPRRAKPPKTSSAKTSAASGRARPAVPKGSINLRIDGHTRALIDGAAEALGKTRTEFMIDSARKVATDVLLDQRLFAFDAARFDAFVAALDAPPDPGPKLLSLVRRSPPWDP